MKTVKKSPAGAAASGCLTAAEAMLPMAAEAEPDLAQHNGGAEKIRTLEAQAEWLETIGIETCFDLHGAEPNNAE